MTDEKKALIAFIVALTHNKRPNRRIGAVYDYGRNRYCHFTDNGSNNRLHIYDNERHSFITGILPNIYDYASNSYINVEIRNNMFSGYDYETAQFFSGTIYDTIVSLYCNGQYSNYSIV